MKILKTAVQEGHHEHIYALTLCMLGNFCMLFCRLFCFCIYFYFIIFLINFFKKNLSGMPSECQTVWIQIRPDVLSGLIWVQTVCKGYQQTTKVATSGERVKWIALSNCICSVFETRLFKSEKILGKRHLKVTMVKYGKTFKQFFSSKLLSLLSLR